MQSCFLGFEFCLQKNPEKSTRRSRRSEKTPGDTLTILVQGISGKKMFLVRFQDGCEKDPTSFLKCRIT